MATQPSDALLSAPINDMGRVSADYDFLIELLLSGKSVDAVSPLDDRRLKAYNENCREFDKREFSIEATAAGSAEKAGDYHRALADTWLNDFGNIVEWEEIFTKCTNDRERERFVIELEEFSRRGLLPILSQLAGLVRALDEAEVVRGVGRGSSVASFLLYLLDVHFINPLDYGLELSEFLR